jgi:hypothetical protein
MTWIPDDAEIVDQQARQVLLQMQDENRRLAQRVQRAESQTIYQTLDASEFGEHWRSINTSESFLSWLAAGDEMAGPGASKGAWLRQAFSAGDANRVLSIFRAYVSEQGGQQTSQQRVQSRRQVSEPVVITNKDIDRHFERARTGYYRDDQQREAEERRIHNAVREGRFRRV